MGNFFWVLIIVASLSGASITGSGERMLRNDVLFPVQYDNSTLNLPFEGCENVTYPPSGPTIPSYRINLDLPPEERWLEVVLDKKLEILGLLASIKNSTDELFGREVFELVDQYMPYLLRTLPVQYYRELVGIAQVVDISLGEVTLFNVFYEFFSVCTSIVARGDDGYLYHGRNLDFGLFLGWDPENHTWLTSEFMRPLVIKLYFTKDNETVFSSVNFAGYIGVLTAVKKDAFSLTVDERFKLDGGYVGLAEWILGRHGQKWMGLLTRDVMLQAKSYQEAQQMLMGPQLIAPVYFILAGNSSHQGSVVTRGRNSSDVWTLGKGHRGQEGGWYLVQTNYDHWAEPPFYDNRRTPAVTCMDTFSNEQPLATLYKTLSTRPVLNKLTIYTSVIDVTSGSLDTWIRFCKDPCWPW